MSAVVQVLDVVTLVAPLVVQFFDEATGTMVRSGLTVAAWPEGQPGQRRAAVASPGGAYNLAHLPGLRRYENGGSSRARNFTVEVVDNAGRYLPMRFTVTAPSNLPTMPSDLGVQSPPTGRDGMIPLFSAPSRTVPKGMAALRADLVDPVTSKPASWALIEVEANEIRSRGIADEAGRALVVFPYPEAPAQTVGSLTSPPQAVAIEYRWRLHVAAYYQPRLHVPEIPDLLDLLDQPAATVWADAERTIPLGALDLVSGTETIVRTAGPGGRGKLSNLYLTPVASPLD
jgi:hypothetical protein